jgi:hypothetical protein
VSKDDDSCSVSFLIFLPSSPLSVLHTSGAQASGSSDRRAVLFSTST